MILGKASSPSHSDRMERDGALKRSENRAAMVFGQARNAFLIPRDDLMQNRRSSMYEQRCRPVSMCVQVGHIPILKSGTRISGVVQRQGNV